MNSTGQYPAIKPLDIVRTPKGAIALVTTVTHDSMGNYEGTSVSIDFIGDSCGERNAWWHSKDNPWYGVSGGGGDLVVLDNLARVLAQATMGNHCNGHRAIDEAFPKR